MAVQNVSIVGGESLLGRELREQLAEVKFPAKLKLIGADAENTKVLSIHEGEPVVLTELDADALEQSRMVLLAGTALSSEKALKLVRETASKPAIIDLTGALEDQPNARLRAPGLEPEGFTVPDDSIHVIAHPAAAVLAQILGRIQKQYPIRHAVVQIFEPASERGQAGITELQQQTASLLSFKAMPKDVFDAQLSFNMLPRYGSDAPARLEDVEHRIDRHLATLAQGTPIPSVRLSQAPVFHGYSFSMWIEFENNPGSVALAEQLASAQIEVRGADLDAPSNVGSVGQSGVTVGLIETDPNHPKAIWLWAVADNFRITVDSAIEVARQLL
jgi:aspartate-semialdehyde dehydrogenase